MTAAGARAALAEWRSLSVVEAVEGAGRGLLVAAVAAAMVTPRLAVGPVHLGAGDVLAVAGVACWAVAWVGARSRAVPLSPAKWPMLAVTAGLVSMAASPDPWASLGGVVQLTALWVLPSLAVPSLFGSDRAAARLLSAAAIGALLAAGINTATALDIGLGGGLPQVWGAAGGFQGYFQVLGMTVALPRLATALSARRPAGVIGWSLALVLHAVALLLTQTRGAWLAAIVAALTLGLVWRRTALVVAAFLAVAAAMVAMTADWGAVIRERMQSVFQPEASLSGFDSSIIRIALALAAWSMFRAHPWTGIGLKCFASVLPFYAPGELPLSVEMGPDLVPTPIEGPHSTYLSLLCETGALGAAAVIGWVATAWWRSYRRQRAVERAARSGQVSAALVGAIAAIAVHNFFGEMNASGAIPFVAFLALGSRLRARPSPAPGR